MKLKPLFDRVVVVPVKESKSSPSPLVLPESAQEKPLAAKILFVGDGGETNGKPVKMYVKIGDKILFNRYAGSSFKLDDQEVIIIRQSDILAIIEEKTNGKTN